MEAENMFEFICCAYVECWCYHGHIATLPRHCFSASSGERCDSVSPRLGFYRLAAQCRLGWKPPGAFQCWGGRWETLALTTVRHQEWNSLHLTLIAPSRHVCLLHFLSLRSSELLLPAAAGLLHSLLHLHPASVPSSEERRPHAHSPQSADHSAGSAGLLGYVQLRPSGQVGPIEWCDVLGWLLLV